MPFSPQPFTLPKVIGHRGACQYAPENTLSSLRKASELAVSWIEFDIVLTKDDEAIVFHDATLDRTTNGSGLVAETSYSTIARLDAGSWFSPEFSGEKVPTFIEYLNNAAKLGLGINVEIKPTPGKEQKTAEKVIALLKQYWPNSAAPPLVSSFSTAALTAARALDTKLYLGLLIDDWTHPFKETSIALDCISVHVKQTLLSKEKVAEIKSYAQYVLAYTVDTVERALALFDMGVDAVFSNRPDILI